MAKVEYKKLAGFEERLDAVELFRLWEVISSDEKEMEKTREMARIVLAMPEDKRIEFGEKTGWWAIGETVFRILFKIVNQSDKTVARIGYAVKGDGVELATLFIGEAKLMPFVEEINNKIVKNIHSMTIEIVINRGLAERTRDVSFGWREKGRDEGGRIIVETIATSRLSGDLFNTIAYRNWVEPVASIDVK